MEAISIGLGEPVTEFRAQLDAALAPVRARGARVDLSESRRGALRFLGCRVEADPGRPEAARAVAADFRGALVGALAAYILERREPTLLRRLIGSHYSYFSVAEREAILGLALSGLGVPGAESPGRRHAQVAERLDDYLQRHATLVLDGFVTFRLKDYVDLLVGAVDRAVDDFLLEREYREFVDLLRHVVESHPDRPAAVHCLFDAAGGVALQEESGAAVAQGFLDEAGPAAAAWEIGLEDLLISALITVAPREVRLHLPDRAAVALSPEALATLDLVFGKRVAVCHGCARCRLRAQR